ncbi:MAG: thioredoxin family protein, partial [Deltaproteobacteria bacterium]|nr:thioredoxin family protein [Deltaproteobacteria bacterium]
RVPRPIEEQELAVSTLLSQSAVRPGDSFLYGIGVRTCEAPRDCDPDALLARDPAEIFLPYSQTNPALRPLGVQNFPDAAGGFLLALRGHTDLDAPPRSEEPLRGILTLPGKGYFEVALSLPTAEPKDEVERFASEWLDPELLERLPDYSIGLVYALGLALIGGLILNLMPCVLPILAIKIVSLSALAHHERKHIAVHGLAYGMGIQASMGILTIAVLALQQAGVGVGWGFQFREPVFLAAISILVVLFACNLFDLFEISIGTSRLDQLGQQSSGTRRSFFDGFLAVALATPCSAPFLGTAVGFAFSEGPIEISLIFASIGLGLALPFIAVSLAPGLSRFVPAPGQWMIRLRVGLGVVLLATAVWLLWILERAAGLEAQVAMLVVLILTGVGAFALGRLQRSPSGGRTRLFVAGFAALIVVTLATLPLQPRAVKLEEDLGGAVPWRAFDKSAIAAELHAQRPVFVYFTADWCITCKVNERLVLEDELVVDALKRLDVATFRGDWTLRDETIRSELARHGKAGVPVYLVYGPDRPGRPSVLPELITVDAVLKALELAVPRESI